MSLTLSSFSGQAVSICARLLLAFVITAIAGQHAIAQYQFRNPYQQQQWQQRQYVPRNGYPGYRNQPNQLQPRPDNSQQTPTGLRVPRQPNLRGETTNPRAGSPTSPQPYTTPSLERERKHKLYPRLPADFEPQTALILSVSDWQPHHADVLKQLVKKTSGHTDLLIFCDDRDQFLRTLDWLKDLSNDCGHVYFAHLDLDTIWLRDFAPYIAQTENGFQPIDFYYVGERPKDDNLPHEFAKRTKSKLVEVPFTLQGGNLLTNGKHFAITTTRIFTDNNVRFLTAMPGKNVDYEQKKIVVDALVEGCNLGQLMILEPLQSEATKHCDMFASFLAADKIVVADVDRRRDPINSAILNRNATRLKTVKVNGRPLNVHRIQIPPRDGESWSAFTNIIIANDLVLMPVYQTDPPQMVRDAVNVYQRLLPNHTIKTVDITTFKQLQGELHCLSMNLPAYAPMPQPTVSYRRAIEVLSSREQTKKRMTDTNSQTNRNRGQSVSSR